MLELKVEGMMCGGCEKRIENALSSFDGVESVKANHENGNVVIKFSKDIDKDAIIAKINDLGFNVL